MKVERLRPPLLWAGWPSAIPAEKSLCTLVVAACGGQPHHCRGSVAPAPERLTSRRQIECSP
jgi:hypothetical protein